MIDEIWIDSMILKEKVQSYISKGTFVEINPGAILDVISKREKSVDEKQTLLTGRIDELGIQIGDYIFVEKDNLDSPCQDIGITKIFSWGMD